ncbi:hypothetical protein QO010_004651 [Caulobacter ginsengisoli]|uniref:Lipoprotein n=1 Tax=Caulobacter ginsengisoli TaxID=400775 RepID=A0ABU0IXX6_9CAUL|nr:hypothetical protein [Caulobacter ginsengisoli]MDQ0466855.1 hypothetical protein [Caulobacter ginsengisoli]
MARSLILLALAPILAMAACAPIDIPAPPVGGPPVASAGDDAAMSRSEVERRQRRLARSQEKICKKHPDRCESP